MVSASVARVRTAPAEEIVVVVMVVMVVTVVEEGATARPRAEERRAGRGQVPTKGDTAKTKAPAARRSAARLCDGLVSLWLSMVQSGTFGVLAEGMGSRDREIERRREMCAVRVEEREV